MEKSISLVAYQSLPFLRPGIIPFSYAVDRAHYADVVALALKDRNPKVRYKALQSIMQNSEWKAINVVPGLLRDRDTGVKQAAVDCLAQFGSPRAVDALYSALHDPNRLIRLKVVGALKKYPKPKYRRGVQRLVQEWDEEVRLAALDTLLEIHCSESFVPTLLDLALDKNQSPTVRKLAFENIRRAERLPITILNRLEEASRLDSSIDLHLEIVNVIAAFPPGREMQMALLQFLHHVSDNVHRAVVQALGDKGDRSAIYHLGLLVKEGRKTAQMMDKYDASLAEIAIKKISARYP